MRGSALLLSALASLAMVGCASAASDPGSQLTAANGHAMRLNVDARAAVEWSDTHGGTNYRQRQTTSIEIGGGQTLTLEFSDLPPEVFNLSAAGGENINLTVTILSAVLENGDVQHQITQSAIGVESGEPQTIAQPGLLAQPGATSTVHIGTDAPGQLQAGFTMDLVALRIE